MNDPADLHLPFARAVATATDALHDEVDPYRLLKAAAPLQEIAPNLSLRLQARARQAFRIRLMLRQAIAGDLAPEV
jgi:hypothetical protein